MTNNHIKLHSDDFGYRPDTDRKILDLLNRSKISGVSVLSTHASEESLKNLATYRTINVALHINLIEGKSKEKLSRISSLVDEDGKFRSLPYFVIRLLLGLVKKEDLEKEIEAQLAALKSKGVIVNTIDSHQHIHAISPIAEIVEKVAKKNKIPFVRSYSNVKSYTFIAKFKYNFLKAVAFLSYLRFYKKFGLPISWQNNNLTIKQFNNISSYTFMSWEGEGLDLTNGVKKEGIFVIHPYLPFDTNKSYITLLRLDK